MQKPTQQSSVYWWTHPRSLLRYLLALDDTPHHVALGTAVGLFVGMTPTPGLQMLLVACAYYALRRVVRFNLTAGLVMTYASNPITALPLAWLQYRIGRLFVGGSLTKAELEAILSPKDGTWWDAAVSAVTELGTAYLLGSVISAAVCAVLIYPLMRWLFHRVRARTDGGAANPQNGSDNVEKNDPDAQKTETSLSRS
jgi:uncharacterized protein (DUF2062 family)